MSLFAAFALCAAPLFAEVKTVPAPQGQGVEGAYQVTVDGQDVAIYRSFDQEEGSGEYYFATFEFTDSVSIEIKAPFALDKATVAPERFGVKTVERNAERVVLEADKPFQISFEPNGRVKPLILFGLAPEENAPKEGDENVVYFGPGVHKPNVVELTDNQTLYVAAGAVLNAGVVASGENITICGRGVIAGTEWERFKGPAPFTIYAKNCKNLTIRDVVLRDSWSWTCVLHDCVNATIDGLRICASNMINDDALDLCNCSNIVVKNCFFRSQDDSIAIKGTTKSNAPCKNILVKDCVFWTDRANIFRVGYECEAENMSIISAENIDVLYYSVDFRDHDHYWANAIIWLQPNQEMPMHNCVFNNFRVRSNGDRCIMLMAKPMRCVYGEFTDPKAGTLSNCVLANFSVYGVEEGFVGELYFRGDTEEARVKNVLVSNFDYFGKKIDESYPGVVIDQFTEGVAVQ